MNKSQVAAARAELRTLTAELRAAGVTVLAYADSTVEFGTPRQLCSCIEWARGLLAHIKSAA